MKHLLFVAAINLFLFSCSTDSVNSNNSTGNNTASKNNEILKKYKKEGFTDKNTFITIIIKSYSDTSQQSDIESQIKNRTLSNIQKYISDNGNTVTQNTRAQILNLMSESGELKKFDDKEGKRYLYIFEINKDNLRTCINQF